MGFFNGIGTGQREILRQNQKDDKQRGFILFWSILLALLAAWLFACVAGRPVFMAVILFMEVQLYRKSEKLIYFVIQFIATFSLAAITLIYLIPVEWIFEIQNDFAHYISTSRLTAPFPFPLRFFVGVFALAVFVSSALVAQAQMRELLEQSYPATRQAIPGDAPMQVWWLSFLKRRPKEAIQGVVGDVWIQKERPGANPETKRQKLGPLSRDLWERITDIVILDNGVIADHLTPESKGLLPQHSNIKNGTTVKLGARDFRQQCYDAGLIEDVGSNKNQLTAEGARFFEQRRWIAFFGESTVGS